MENNSTINSQDHTYPTGYLADPHLDKIKVLPLNLSLCFNKISR